MADDLAEALARLESCPGSCSSASCSPRPWVGCGIVLQSRRRPEPGAGGARSDPSPRGHRALRRSSPRSASSSRAFLLLQLSLPLRQRPDRPGIGRHLLGIRSAGIRRADHGGDPLHVLLVALDHWAARGPRERWARIAAIVVVGQVEVLLISALRRLWLYESAYGFTTLRLYAHAYMVAAPLPRAARLESVPGVLTVGWLARRAAGRRRRDGHPDLLEPRSVDRPAERRALPPNRSARHVLPGLGLSPNAAPALVRRSQLPPILAERCATDSGSATEGPPQRPVPLVRVESRPGTRGGRARARAASCEATPASRLGTIACGQPRERSSGVTGATGGRALRVHVPAAAARAQREARVEALDGRLELPLDVGHVHRHLVEEPIAALAEPEERLGLLGPALDLDHQPPRCRRGGGANAGPGRAAGTSRPRG